MASLKQRCGWADKNGKSFLRKGVNRILHSMARSLPGAWGFRAKLHRWRGVKIKGDVFVSSGVYIDDGHPEYLTLGDNVCLGVGSMIITHFRDQEGRTVIEDDVFVGAGAIIMPGVTIGKGSVIGANSVVTRDIPPHTFAGGSPAKPIKKVKNPLGVTGSYKAYKEGLCELD